MTPKQRRTLIEVLLDDKQSQLAWDNDLKTSILMEGFQGFDNMSEAELIQCAVDAGLTKNVEIAFING